MALELSLLRSPTSLTPECTCLLTTGEVCPAALTFQDQLKEDKTAVTDPIQGIPGLLLRGHHLGSVTVVEFFRISAKRLPFG